MRKSVSRFLLFSPWPDRRELQLAVTVNNMPVETLDMRLSNGRPPFSTPALDGSYITVTQRVIS